MNKKSTEGSRSKSRGSKRYSVGVIRVNARVRCMCINEIKLPFTARSYLLESNSFGRNSDICPHPRTKTNLLVLRQENSSSSLRADIGKLQ
jgi:hypothetical protein